MMVLVGTWIIFLILMIKTTILRKENLIEIIPYRYFGIFIESDFIWKFVYI